MTELSEKKRSVTNEINVTNYEKEYISNNSDFVRHRSRNIYGAAGDYKNLIYWLAAAVLNITVTF